MKLNVEDISQYIVLLIFILIILKVVGPGVSAYFVERFTGHKPSKGFELDELIKVKEGQLRRGELLETPKDLSKVNLVNFQYVQEVLSSLQWGAPKEEYCPKTTKLIGKPLYNERLAPLIHSLLAKSDEEVLNKDTFFKIFDKYVLWVNIYNAQKNDLVLNTINANYSAKSLYRFITDDINEVNRLDIKSIQAELESFTQEELLNKLNINTLSIEDFFQDWSKNAFLFKSLAPIVPLSSNKNKDWAKEVLKLDSEIDGNQLKIYYENIVSQVHPDKFSSLNLDENLLEILNHNLSIINEAYNILTEQVENE
ncbi:DnaJ family molecular chaperone [Halobacteriovorax sp. HLS]|uniref:J domain-containing protein n=1 Tax=Halobacteriovorax sp. HLS TaxID=2234000 RepID=UPI000FD7E5B1|nr:hypothetical protein [Halobacteriovorax sp. HLS]